MNGHHLILGETVDFLTGKILKDTHDERYRQALARLLVEKRGYLKKEITPRCPLKLEAGEKKARITIDFKVTLLNQDAMVIRYGPGSLVTRRRPALAASRLLSPYQIPRVVVTNGEDAEILSGTDGQVIGQGLEALPERGALMQIVSQHDFQTIPAHRAMMEHRILYAYEVEGSCPCDDTICRL
jgi:hypothetical protein